jgi:hypothetical protein
MSARVLALYPSRPAAPVAQPVPLGAAQPAVIARTGWRRLGVGLAIWWGIRVGIGVEPDPQPDPTRYPTSHASWAVTTDPDVATNPWWGFPRGTVPAVEACR